jgi:hypothetical protein
MTKRSENDVQPILISGAFAGPIDAYVAGAYVNVNVDGRQLLFMERNRAADLAHAIMAAIQDAELQAEHNREVAERYWQEAQAQEGRD